MEHIKIINRTIKDSGEIKLRFRIRDGRGNDLYYRSDIIADLDDLKKFTPEGYIKPKVYIYNHDLANKINNIMLALHQAYNTLKNEDHALTGHNLQLATSNILSGKKDKETTHKNATIIQSFAKFREDGYRDGVFADNRYKHYRTLCDKLDRFLRIKQMRDLTPNEFSINLLMEFRTFLLDEFLYVEKYPYLYSELRKPDIPLRRRSVNTVVTEQKMLKSFFTALEDSGRLARSPFRLIGTERRKNILRAKYNEPWYLRNDEFNILLKKEPPTALKEAKDAFLVQCALGFRISDFKSLTMENVSADEEGIPYIHYLPKKTQNSQSNYMEIKTPIVRFAFDIIKRTGLDFPVLRNATGRTGYNAKIKSLLQNAGIDRKITRFNEETNANEYVPLSSLAGSSLARRTHVDMLTKVQINFYASGLHSEGSKAVKRYTSLELKDQFQLLNVAFDQAPFCVDKDLRIKK